MIEAWPREQRADQARFEKLKEAYVKARYSKHYKISLEELEWIAARVEQLGQIVHSICAERIDALQQQVERNGSSTTRL